MAAGGRFSAGTIFGKFKPLDAEKKPIIETVQIGEDGPGRAPGSTYVGGYYQPATKFPYQGGLSPKLAAESGVYSQLLKTAYGNPNPEKNAMDVYSAINTLESINKTRQAEAEALFPNGIVQSAQERADADSAKRQSLQAKQSRSFASNITNRRFNFNQSENTLLGGGTAARKTLLGL